eukprot:1139018-Pelagomonas_calceolata.AAC.18
MLNRGTRAPSPGASTTCRLSSVSAAPVLYERFGVCSWQSIGKGVQADAGSDIADGECQRSVCDSPARPLHSLPPILRHP